MQDLIKVLDCTLRDGGYHNNWFFGEDTIYSLIKNLHESGVDFIECGFLKECLYNSNKTFFKTVNQLESYLFPNQNYTFMVNFGEYSLMNFSICNNKNIKIRVAFKKHHQKEALIYIENLKNLGWDVFANPMNTNSYSYEELGCLIDSINKINPYGISIVDTLGNMYEEDVIKIFEYIDKNLNPNISIGFHTHNSMQLSFSNTKALLKMKISRQIVIDSCLYGMGRGAGNLCTELITKYLNDNYNAKYKISPILNVIHKDIKPIYEKSPWGYSTPYYIAAICGCHPNYANYLIKNGFSDEEIQSIVSKISIDKKSIYDEKYIESIAKIFI